MITQQLEDYIRAELAKGTSFETIKTNLLAGGGWQLQEITTAYTRVTQGGVMPLQKKNKRWLVKILIAFFIICAAGAAYAYYAGYFISLAQVTGKAFVEARNAQSALFDTTISIDTSGLKKPATETANPLASMFSGPTSFTTKGGYDFSDPANTKLSLHFALNLGSIALAGDVRATDGIAYAELTKTPVIAFIPTLTNVQNKWASFPYKSESKDVAKNPLLSYTGIDTDVIEKLTDEQKDELYAITAKAHFITIVKRLAPETINGENSYHFTFDLDRAGIKEYGKNIEAYIQEAGKNDSALSTFNPTKYLDDIDTISNFNGEMWIGRSDTLLRKIVVNFTIDADDEGPVKVTMVSIFDQWNKPVTVDVPKDALPFEEFIQQVFSPDTAMPASNTTYTQKASDAAIKSTLANLRASAEIYYDSDATHGYKGVYTASADFKNAKTKFGATLSCADSLAEFATSTKLSTGKYFCIDSIGTAKEVSQSISGKTACPNI